jgi:hypothetical protein
MKIPFLRFVSLIALASVAQPASAQGAMDFELSGSDSPPCDQALDLYPAREGFDLNYTVNLGFDLLLGEPVIRSQMTWVPRFLAQACIKPYGSEAFVQSDLPAVEADTSGPHPYDFAFVALLQSPAAPGEDIYVRFNPGALAARAGEPSYNTPGARDWARLFFTMEAGSLAFADEAAYVFLPADAAKTVFEVGFTVHELYIAHARYDMTPLKEAYTDQARRLAVHTAAARKLAAWGAQNIADYPQRLPQEISENAEREPADGLQAQKALLEQMRQYHASALEGADEALKAEVDAIEGALDGLDAALQDQAALHLALRAPMAAESAAEAQVIEAEKAALRQAIVAQTAQASGGLALEVDNDGAAWIIGPNGERIRRAAEGFILVDGTHLLQALAEWSCDEGVTQLQLLTALDGVTQAPLTVSCNRFERMQVIGPEGVLKPGSYKSEDIEVALVRFSPVPGSRSVDCSEGEVREDFDVTRHRFRLQKDFSLSSNGSTQDRETRYSRTLCLNSN